ncbi:TM1812 family CRISPR-associated protein [Acidianus infernus]
MLAEVMKKEENEEEEVKICSVDKRNLYAHGGFEKNVRIVVKISA